MRKRNTKEADLSNTKPLRDAARPVTWCKCAKPARSSAVEYGGRCTKCLYLIKEA